MLSDFLGLIHIQGIGKYQSFELFFTQDEC